MAAQALGMALTMGDAHILCLRQQFARVVCINLARKHHERSWPDQVIEELLLVCCLHLTCGVLGVPDCDLTWPGFTRLVFTATHMDRLHMRRSLAVCRCLMPLQSGSFSLTPPACLRLRLVSWGWTMVLRCRRRCMLLQVQAMQGVIEHGWFLDAEV